MRGILSISALYSTLTTEQPVSVKPQSTSLSLHTVNDSHLIKWQGIGCCLWDVSLPPVQLPPPSQLTCVTLPLLCVVIVAYSRDMQSCITVINTQAGSLVTVFTHCASVWSICHSLSFTSHQGAQPSLGPTHKEPDKV